MTRVIPLPIPADLALSSFDAAAALLARDGEMPELLVCGPGHEDVVRALRDHAPRTMVLTVGPQVLVSPYAWVLSGRETSILSNPAV